MSISWLGVVAWLSSDSYSQPGILIACQSHARAKLSGEVIHMATSGRNRALVDAALAATIHHVRLPLRPSDNKSSLRQFFGETSRVTQKPDVLCSIKIFREARAGSHTDASCAPTSTPAGMHLGERIYNASMQDRPLYNIIRISFDCSF